MSYRDKTCMSMEARAGPEPVLGTLPGSLGHNTVTCTNGNNMRIWSSAAFLNMFLNMFVEPPQSVTELLHLTPILVTQGSHAA